MLCLIKQEKLFWNISVSVKTIPVFQGFYDEIANPLLSEVELRYPDNAVDSLTKNHFNHLFNGSEIVVAGRLTDNDLDNFLVEVLGQGVRKSKDTINIYFWKRRLSCKIDFCFGTHIGVSGVFDQTR